MKSDYTLMNDKCIEKPGLDFMFMTNIGEEWDEQWGGGTHFVNGTETALSIYPAENTLWIVMRDENIHKFSKMVNNQCQSYCVEFSGYLSEKTED
jgi:hypothetical protein